MRQHAILVKHVSPDTKLAVTKKGLEGFTKDVLDKLQFNRTIKNALLVLIEVEGEKV
jgi:hypothetical protein